MATNADGTYKIEDDSVASRVAAITSGNSDLMKLARTQGMQSANRRGLGNSTMAVGAAQSATLNAAVPIASQEASQVAQRNLAGMNSVAEEARLMRSLDSEMSRTRLGLDAEASRQQAAIAAESERLGRSLDAESSRLDRSLAADAEKLKAQIAAEQQRAMLSSVTDLTGQRFNAISNTLANDKIPSGTRAAVQSSIDGQYNQALDYLQNLYGVSLSPAAATTATSGTTLTPAQIIAAQRAGLGVGLTV